MRGADCVAELRCGRLGAVVLASGVVSADEPLWAGHLPEGLSVRVAGWELFATQADPLDFTAAPSVTVGLWAPFLAEAARAELGQ